MNDSPVCVLFADYKINPHLTLASLQDVVIADIQTRYGVPLKEVKPREEIYLDPGGMAFSPDRAEYIELEYKGIKFRCQSIHLLNTIRVMRLKQNVMETEAGLLVRLYLDNCVLVLPMEWFYPLITFLESFSEEGKRANEEFVKLLKK